MWGRPERDSSKKAPLLGCKTGFGAIYAFRMVSINLERAPDGETLLMRLAVDSLTSVPLNLFVVMGPCRALAGLCHETIHENQAQEKIYQEGVPKLSSSSTDDILLDSFVALP